MFRHQSSGLSVRANRYLAIEARPSDHHPTCAPRPVATRQPHWPHDIKRLPLSSSFQPQKACGVYLLNLWDTKNFPQQEQLQPYCVSVLVSFRPYVCVTYLYPDCEHFSCFLSPIHASHCALVGILTLPPFCTSEHAIRWFAHSEEVPGRKGRHLAHQSSHQLPVLPRTMPVPILRSKKCSVLSIVPAGSSTAW